MRCRHRLTAWPSTPTAGIFFVAVVAAIYSKFLALMGMPFFLRERLEQLSAFNRNRNDPD